MQEIYHECYVDLEVAKLLKEAGFDWECCYCYDAETKDFLDDNEGEFNFNEGDDNDFYSAPTLDVVQRWLRETKGLEIEVVFLTEEYRVYYQANLYEIVSEKANEYVSELVAYTRGQSKLTKTYEEAQEAGIKKALEIILENGE